MADELLIRLHASTPRRVLGVAVLAALGLWQMYFAFMTPPDSMGFKVVLLFVGAGALWLAARMWQASQAAIELTTTALRLSDGTLLALTEDITGIDRGVFAFKPSHGFTVRIDTRLPGAWHPGMFWRIGRRIGVGGLTSATQTKVMADMISAMVAARQPQ